MSDNENDQSPSEKTEADYIQELWQFPCDYLFKAMAVNQPDVDLAIVSVIQEFVPGDYSPKISPSKQGNYVAVSLTFKASSKQQLDQIYLAVNALECVKFCL